MTFDCVNNGMEEESLNTANITREIKTRDIFSSVSRVSSVLPATAATSASVEWVDSKERVPSVPCSIAAASYR